MNIEKVLEKIHVVATEGELGFDITGVYSDSRDVSLGSLFVAVSGIQVDGHSYIDQAINRGARAIVSERLPQTRKPQVTYFVVNDTQGDLGRISANFYNNPSDHMNIVAITGTNGKTTIAQMMYHALLNLGEKATVFSTAGDYINGKKVFIERRAASSLEPIIMQKYLAEAYAQGCRYVCIEATSHALDQQRYSGINISRAVFTNLSQDHLDYHKTMEHYVSSKKKLFDGLGKDSVSIINTDDDYAREMVSDTCSRVLTYGQDGADYSFDTYSYDAGVSSFDINGLSVHVPVIGLFNVYNAVAVYGLLNSFAYSHEQIATALSELPGVSGRMEYVKNNKGIIAIVDYAHTPDALEQVLETLANVSTSRIITVVGCGGDRDRSKRPIMSSIAQQKSDYVFFTADNPRHESLDQIFGDMNESLDARELNYEYIKDRKEAVSKAVSLAAAGDIVLVAGKGHEQYQEIGDKKTSFSDVEVLAFYLNT